MTPAQLARRRRVLDAVIDLVAAGRLDDMGMKDVAERSGVALGTIYRYFSSRDHLAAAALADWAGALDGGPTSERSGAGEPGNDGEPGCEADGGEPGGDGEPGCEGDGGGPGGGGEPGCEAERGDEGKRGGGEAGARFDERER